MTSSFVGIEDEVRLLFLNPPDLEGRIYMKELGRCGRLSAAGEIWPQTGLASLAAVARCAGACVELCDAMALRWLPSRTAEHIRAFQPDVLFVHVSTPTFNNDRDFCAELSKEVPNVIVVVVGSHGSALGAEMLRDFPADYVLVGEGEETVRQIVGSEINPLSPVGRFRDARFSSGGSLSRKSADLPQPLLGKEGTLNPSPASQGGDGTVPCSPPFQGGDGGGNSSKSSVQDSQTGAISLPPGFQWLDMEGNVVSSGNAGFISDLDVLPFPARDLLPNEKYKMPFFGREPFATVISSRGCPYGCSFCRAGVSWGKRVRTRSVPSVIEEIRQLRDRYKMRNIVFMTDSFTFDRDWVLQLCEAMTQQTPEIRWICNSRVDAVDEEILTAMKRAGCLLISYGLESGSQTILDSCHKGISLDDSKRAVALTRQAGIISFGYFILGLPEETWETVHETIDFALEVEPDYALFHIATPFPGTRLYDEALEKGLLLNQDWRLCDEESAGILRTVALSADDLAQARRMAMRRFYLRPRILARELSRTASLGSLIARGRAAVRMTLNWAGKKHQCEGVG